MCVDCTNSINDTPQGTSGDDGASAYLYIAYANDITGSGFSMSDATKCFKALKNTTTPLTNPQQSDFNDLWFDTCGTNGSNGSNGKNADGTNLVSTVGLVDTYQIVNEDNVPIGNFTVTNGADGADGTDAIVDLGTVSTGIAGSSVIITNTGPTPNNAVFNFTIPRGNTGSQGPKGDPGEPGADADPATITVYNSSGASIECNSITFPDESVTLNCPVVVAVPVKNTTFQAVLALPPTTSFSLPPNLAATKGIPEDGLVIEFLTFYENATAIPTPAGSATCSFGIYNTSTNIFTFTKAGEYLLNARVHLKLGGGDTDWTATTGEIGVGFCVDYNGIYGGNYQVVLGGITKQIDITISKTARISVGDEVDIRILNRTGTSYTGPSSGNDGIDFSITKLV